jgi:3',5'-cyclic AMP phosphodiesterase CpdA
MPPESDSSEPSAAVVLAAGDIASCDSNGDEATAALLDERDGTILALGDLAYEDGSSREFGRCYGPSWGRHRDRTRPAVGNHDYQTAGAEDYFDYFGPTAGMPGEGWYAFDLGGWHLVALNSNCDLVACGTDSPQLAWLEEDLAANPADCTLAYMHHPRWSSGDGHGPIDMTDALWRTLHAAGVDLLLGGHDHTYERFGPMDAEGVASSDGLVQFVVGTGGRSLYQFADILPTSAAHDASTFGLLQLTLREGAYDWAFIPVEGGTFTDTGTAS